MLVQKVTNEEEYERAFEKGEVERALRLTPQEYLTMYFDKSTQAEKQKIAGALEGVEINEEAKAILGEKKEEKALKMAKKQIEINPKGRASVFWGKEAQMIYIVFLKDQA